MSKRGYIPPDFCHFKTHNQADPYTAMPTNSGQETWDPMGLKKDGSLAP